MYDQPAVPVPILGDASRSALIAPRRGVWPTRWVASGSLAQHGTWESSPNDAVCDTTPPQTFCKLFSSRRTVPLPIELVGNVRQPVSLVEKFLYPLGDIVGRFKPFKATYRPTDLVVAFKSAGPVDCYGHSLRTVQNLNDDLIDERANYNLAIDGGYRAVMP